MTKHKNPHPDSKHAKHKIQEGVPTTAKTHTACKGSKCAAAKPMPEQANPKPVTEIDRQLAQDAITTGKSAQVVHPDGTRERVRLSELYRNPEAPEVRHTKSRWVYHFSGHARLHATRSNPGADSKDQAQAVPFEVVIRRPWPVTSDSDMELARVEVRGHIVSELAKQDSPYIVGDVMIRGVSFLHRILVDHDNLEGEPVKVFP